MRAWLGGALAAVALVGVASAQAPVGTAFTYQGRLTDGGAPATGSFDFRFTLFDAATGGAAVGAPVSVNGVAVAQGLFASVLDFGASAFSGQARWVQVEVRPAGGGAYTTLVPRQELTVAPYALFSSFTDPAHLTSLDASNLTSGTLPGPRLGGTYALAVNLSNPANTINGTFTGPGGGLTGLNAGNLATGTVPSAVLSGTYSNPLTLSNPANVLFGNGAGLTNLNAQPRYVRTLVVSPLASPAGSGNALLAAIASITTAGPANPFLIKVEPGVYDVGSTSFVMKPNVDVEGSGEGVTRITGVGNASNAAGTVHAVTGSELRQLTVENRGGAAFAKALFVDGGSPSIHQVTAVAFGGTTESQAFFAQANATAVVRNLTAIASATGTASSFGVLNILGSGSVYSDLRASANGGAFARAVATYNGSAPTFRNAVAIASGATTENQGVASFQSSPFYENLVAIATGTATNNLGCLTFGTPSTATFRTATCRALFATAINHGMLTNGGANAAVVDLTAEAVGGTTARGVEHNGCGGGTTVTHARVVATGGTSSATGLANLSCSPRIVQLEAYASGPANANVSGVSSQDGAPSLLHVTATAAGGGTGIVVGVHNGLAAFPTLEHVSANASGGQFAYGVLSDVTSGRPSLRSVTANAFDATQFTIGVLTFADPGTGVSLTGVVATASAAVGSVAGVYTDGGAAALTNVTASASGGSTRYGLVNGATTTTTTTVDASTLSGSTASAFSQGSSTLRVANSHLAGPVNNLVGSTSTCIFSTNAAYGVLNAACQ